jgi:hypothetical protein
MPAYEKCGDKSSGAIGDLDDGPDQTPLPEIKVEHANLNLLPEKAFDIIISHYPTGEYTKQINHKVTSRAVIALRYRGKMFAHKF